MSGTRTTELEPSINFTELSCDYDQEDQQSIVKKARWQSKKYFLTYKTHIPKELLIECLTTALRCWGIEFIRCAHESADENRPYEHTHVLLQLKRKSSSTKTNLFDFDSIHPHVKSVRTITHWKNLLVYISKEDIANLDLRPSAASRKAKESGQSPPINMEDIWNCDSLQDALSAFIHTKADLSLANAIKTAYSCKPTPKIQAPRMDELRPWQSVCDSIIDSKPDERTIHWFFGRKGNEGKSVYAKHRYTLDPDSILLATQFNGAANAGSLIFGAIQNGWNGHCLILNLSRKQEFHEIYAPIEMIKDGVITNTKYQSQTCVFNNPHVVVFANFPPHVYDDVGNCTVSLDRWKIYEIDDNFQAVPKLASDFKDNVIEQSPLIGPCST